MARQPESTGGHHARVGATFVSPPSAVGNRRVCQSVRHGAPL
jgi:hypothetical protein